MANADRYQLRSVLDQLDRWRRASGGKPVNA
jgi:hypothetical protein